MARLAKLPMAIGIAPAASLAQAGVHAAIPATSEWVHIGQTGELVYQTTSATASWRA